MPNAFITGISGQDGAYLARLLLDRGYSVWGATRAQTVDAHESGGMSAGPNRAPESCLKALSIAERVRLICVDYSQDSLKRALELASPDEIYNLAAQSSIPRSFEMPVETGEITGLAVVRLLSASLEVCPRARFFQASSSEMFGDARGEKARESTRFEPRNPYGMAKVYAHSMTKMFRDHFGLSACCGLLFNHESPLRPERFVTRKICAGAARIALGLQDELLLGNLDIERDWGFAGDTVQAMHLMLQQDSAQDYIIATGEPHSVREFVELAFASVGLQAARWVRSDPALVRPNENPIVVADPSKAWEQLGWKPRVSFPQLVQFLVEAELKRARGEEQDIAYFP